MQEIFDTMKRVSGAGCGQVFLLTGNVRDAYPHPLDEVDAGLYTLVEILRMNFPQHLLVQLSFSGGLQVLDETIAGKFRYEVLGLSKPAENNPLAAALQAMHQSEGPVIAADPVEGLNMLRTAFAQDKISILVLAPRLELLAPRNVGHDRSARTIIESLLNFAEDDNIAKNGHLLVLTAPEAAEVDERLSGTTSRVVQLRIARPDENKRQHFFRRLTIAPELEERREELETELNGIIDDFVKDKERHLGEVLAHIEMLRAELLTVKAPENLLRELSQFQEKLAQAETLKRELTGVAQQKALRRTLRDAKKHEQSHLDWLTRHRLTSQCWRELQVGEQLCGFIKSLGMAAYEIVKIHPDRTIELSDQVRLVDTPVTAKSLTSMCSNRTHTFTGKTLRFIFNEKADLVLGTEHQGSEGIAFWFPKRDENDSGPSCWLYVLSSADSPAGVQAELKAFEYHQKFREDTEVILGRLQAGEMVETEVTKGAEEDIRKFQQCLAALQEQINQAIATAAQDVETKIAEQMQRQLDIQALITDARGPRSKLPKDIKKRVDTLSAELDRLRIGRFPPPAAELVTLARLSNGMDHRSLRDLLAMAEANAHRLDESDVFKARTRKLTESFGHLAEVVDARWGFDGVGGLEWIKDELRLAARNMIGGNYRAVPQGILLMGPPGTGKSVLAEALAYETGYGYVRVKSLRNMFVGESERQTDALLAFVREAAPLIIERDEIDEEDAGRDAYQGDSGVSGRIRRAWMTFLSDPAIQGRVLVLAITNRPDRLDAALTRSARMDYRIPVLMPDQDTRADIFRVMFGVWYKIPTDIRDFTKYAALTAGRPGSDIRFIVQESEKWATRDGRSLVTDVDLLRAIQDVRPSVDWRVVDEWSQLAIAQASNYRFIPPEWREKMRESDGACCRVEHDEEKSDRDTLVVTVPVAIGRKGGSSSSSGQGSASSPGKKSIN
jgi:SpoVK/Ycf46/Vps4 family AAA+-type ATPase